MGKRLPNFFIVGVTKAGTTSLYTYLNAHPECAGSSIKETEYFKPKYFDPSLVNLTDYGKYFESSKDEKYVFEATPNYINGKERLASYLSETFDGCRVAIILREPVARVVSFFNHCKDLLLIDKDMPFSDYLDECERQMEISAIPEKAQWQALARPYADTVPSWMNVFGKNLWIGYFEEMKDDPAAFTDDLCCWLEIQPASQTGVSFSTENATIRPSSVGLHRIAIEANRIVEPFLRRNHGLKKMARNAYHRINKSKDRGQQPSGADMDRLREYFCEPNQRLLSEFRAKHPWQSPPPWLQETD